MSRNVNTALQRQLQRDRIISLLNALEDERGPIDPEVMAEVQREWPAPSVKRPASSQRLMLDSGAVIAAPRGDDRALAYLRRAVELDAEIHIPVAVVAETIRGGPRDSLVNRVLNAVGRSEATTETVGRLAGELLGRAKRDNRVDALVVAEAISVGGGRILTGDPADLSALADGARGIEILPLNR